MKKSRLEVLNEAIKEAQKQFEIGKKSEDITHMKIMTVLANELLDLRDKPLKK